MYISIEWLKNFVNLTNIPLSLICNKLTLAGFEIESTTHKNIQNNSDIVLDISLTANRPDIFNIKELSEEINTILNLSSKKEFKQKKYLKKVAKKIPFFSFSNQSYQRFIQKNIFCSHNEIVLSTNTFDKCSFFFNLRLEGLQVKQSPKWLKNVLIASNITPINNIIDTINYILLETGYPFTVYDLSKLKRLTKNSEFKFKTQLATGKEDLSFRDNKKNTLTRENLLVFIDENPIAIAGLGELSAFSVTEETTEILIQGGFFDPIQIRKSSQTLGLRTEISTRFEKRLNINSLEKAIIRLYHLFYVQKIFLKDLLNPKIEHLEFFKSFIENENSSLIVLDYQNVNTVLGPRINFQLIEKEEILRILKNLHFSIEILSKKSCKVYVPFARRYDITREIDLIEEIGRIIGFNSFYAQMPMILNLGQLSKLEKLKRQLRLTFLTFGFFEVLHPTLISYHNSNQITLKNPLLNESSSLRSSLLEILLERVSFNQKQGNTFLESFEIGRIYKRQSNGSIIEKDVISGVFGSKPYKKDWIKKDFNIEWLEAKGIIEEIFQQFNLKLKWQKPLKINNLLFHPGRMATLFVANEKIGSFGELHPIQSKLYDINQSCYLFEFDLHKIETVWLPKQLFDYSTYSVFPSSIVDLSCIVPKNKIFEQVETKIQELGKPLLKSIELFDYYSGEEIPSGYYSLGFKLKFQDQTRTLKNLEINFLMDQIIKELQSSLQIIFRNKI